MAEVRSGSQGKCWRNGSAQKETVQGPGSWSQRQHRVQLPVQCRCRVSVRLGGATFLLGRGLGAGTQDKSTNPGLLRVGGWLSYYADESEGWEALRPFG